MTNKSVNLKSKKRIKAFKRKNKVVTSNRKAVYLKRNICQNAKNEN